jgi:hypothetical protein
VRDPQGGYQRHQDNRGRRQDNQYQSGGGEPRRQTRVEYQEGRRQVYPPHQGVELRERLNLAKEKKEVDERKEEELKKLKCFRCQEAGHHEKDCTKAHICYKCKEEGHMVAECASFHSKAEEMKMYGFAIPRQGFYNIKIHGEAENFKASCIIQVLHGDANEKKLEEELKNLIDNKWDWMVK